MVPDLRGGFSHLIAALAATGESNVHGIGLIDRGYERFSDKLAALGVDCEWRDHDRDSGEPLELSPLRSR